MLSEEEAATIIQLADALADAAVKDLVVSSMSTHEEEQDAELALVAFIGGLISHD